MGGAPALPTAEMLMPRLAELKDVPQSAVHHGEGDVLCHTRRVMEALASLPGYQAMPAAEQELLMAAAALHDLGKKITTVWENGDWTSPNHGRVGASLAREMLMSEFGLAGTRRAMLWRETVCALIRLHMKPLYIMEAKDPGRAARTLSSVQVLLPDFSLEKLALLAQADNLGRVCGDQAARLTDIELFRELAREEGCLNKPFAWPDPFSRYADLSGRNVAPGQALYNDSWGTVLMVCGLPGTGKDTWIRGHCPELPMLSLDGVREDMGVKPTDDQGRVIQAAQERARQYLRAKTPFVFNATNLSEMLRRKWAGLFHQYGAMVRMVYLETGVKERERRNLSREKAVPESAVSHMLRQLDPPQVTEAEEVEWNNI